MSSLSDKLKALGVTVGAPSVHAKEPNPASAQPIEAVVAGRFFRTPVGETFAAEVNYDSAYRHGIAPLHLPELETLAAWAGAPQLKEVAPENVLYLDTETSGLAGGTGTYAFMVGAARYDANGQFVLKQFFMRSPGEENALLEGLAHFMAGSQAIVTFNGKAFDVPLLRTRYSLHSIPHPFDGLIHLDLLPLARRLWRERLPSRALKYLEENILLAPRSSEEVPGYEIPWLYFDFLRTRDARPLAGVFYHNAMDMVAMAALLNHVGQIFSDPFSGRVQHGLDFVALAKLFEDIRRPEEAARLYERALEQGDLSEADFWQTVKRLSILQKRRGDLQAALAWWQRAAGEGHIYAHVELAKYYEHRVRDYPLAIHYTHSALELAQSPRLAAYEQKYWQNELGARSERLARKMNEK
jgi:uncharacterized protein